MLIEGLARRSPARSASAQPPDQARGIPAPAAHLRDLVVEAGDRLGDRELRAVLLCGLGADAQVLPHPVHGETEVELVVDHGLAAILHLPGLRRALGDHLEHQLRVQAGLESEVQAFREPWTRPAIQIWLTILVSCPAPEGP